MGRSPARRHARPLPGLPRFPGGRGQHRSRDSEQLAGPTSPTSQALAGSSQTYSFPTAYASRRGDVTDRRSTRSGGGRGAPAQAPPPPRGGTRPVPPCLGGRASAPGRLPRARGLRRLARLGGRSSPSSHSPCGGKVGGRWKGMDPREQIKQVRSRAWGGSEGFLRSSSADTALLPSPGH